MKQRITSMSRRRLIVVLLLVVAALCAGVYFSGILGGEPVAVKRSPDPIPLAEPFIINLADTEASHLIKIGVAVSLEPMTEHDILVFDSGGEGGGHGSATTSVTGRIKVGDYPPFRDAVIDVTSRFTSTELHTGDGKERLKEQLLQRFDEVADSYPEPKHAKGTEVVHDPAAPPFHVQNIYFTEFAIQ